MKQNTMNSEERERKQYCQSFSKLPEKISEHRVVNTRCHLSKKGFSVPFSFPITGKQCKFHNGFL